MPALRSFRITALAAATVLLAACATSPRAGSEPGKFLEATIAVPREYRIPVDIAFRGAVVTGLETHNAPGPAEVEAARTKDPSDKTVVLFRFTYNNSDYVSHRVNLRIVVLDESGGVLADGGRTGTLDAKTTEDTISFPVTVRTLDWPRAANVKVLATFLD